MISQNYKLEHFNDRTENTWLVDTKHDIWIVQHSNHYLIPIKTIQIVDRFFTKHPSIKCVYGDSIVKSTGKRLYYPTFNIKLLTDPNWQPTLFIRDINFENDPLLLVKPIGEIAQHIIKQGTFIYHIPEVLVEINE